MEASRDAQNSPEPEHPRASNTDDVECFFSVLRDHVGPNFTLKQTQFAWRKVCLEFEKRINPDLPLYYFTSAHDRFYEGPCPSFNEPSKKKKRLPRGEQVQSLTSGRATLPVRGTLTIRPKFHKHPLAFHHPQPLQFTQLNIHTVKSEISCVYTTIVKLIIKHFLQMSTWQ